MAMLPHLIPPFRYSIVEESFYRGSYPTLRNYRFLKRLHLKTIVSLTPEPHTNRDMRQFCEQEKITNRHFYVDKFQDVVTLSNAKVLQILQTIIRPENLPLYLHCLDGTHVTGLVVMCFRKLQSWNLATSAAEFCSFQKSGEISRDESQFVEAFKGEIEIPPVIPDWLWQGVRTVKHPTFRLRLLPVPANSEKTDEDAASKENNNTEGYFQGKLPTYQIDSQSSSLGNSGRNRGVTGLAALVNASGQLSRLTISAQSASDSMGKGVIYGAGVPQDRGVRTKKKLHSTAVSVSKGHTGVSETGGPSGSKSPKKKAMDRKGKRSEVGGARFSHDGWKLLYTERRRTVEALDLEGLRVSGNEHPVKLPQLPRLPPAVQQRNTVSLSREGTVNVENVNVH